MFLIDDAVVNQDPQFTITDTKLYVLVVTLSAQGNQKLFEQLKSINQLKMVNQLKMN